MFIKLVDPTERYNVTSVNSMDSNQIIFQPTVYSLFPWINSQRHDYDPAPSDFSRRKLFSTAKRKQEILCFTAYSINTLLGSMISIVGM